MASWGRRTGPGRSSEGGRVRVKGREAEFAEVPIERDPMWTPVVRGFASPRRPAGRPTKRSAGEPGGEAARYFDASA